MQPYFTQKRWTFQLFNELIRAYRISTETDVRCWIADAIGHLLYGEVISDERMNRLIIILPDRTASASELFDILTA